MRLIHLGSGKVRMVDVAEFTAAPEARPRKPQKLRLGVKTFYSRNDLPIRETGTGYQPGKLTNLALDQCKYDIGGKMMCGAKTCRNRRGQETAWCADHFKIVYEVRG